MLDGRPARPLSALATYAFGEMVSGRAKLMCDLWRVNLTESSLHPTSLEPTVNQNMVNWLEMCLHGLTSRQAGTNLNRHSD